MNFLQGKISFVALLCFSTMVAVTSGVAQTNFAVLVNDGAWTWFNDPRAIYHNGQLYFGYTRAADGRVILSTLNLQSGAVTNLWASGLTLVDDHDVPGLLQKQDGTLLAIYSRHQNDQFFSYRLSTSTNSISPSDWGAEQTNNTGTFDSSGMTYANPFELSAEGGKIYNFARYLNYNPNVFTSTDGGATWSMPQIFIQTGTGGSIRPYVKYCSDYDHRIDFIYTDGHPDNIPTSLYHLYYQSNAFYQTDGTFLKNYADLPILHDSGERGSVIYQYDTAVQSNPNQWIPSGRAWCWEVGYQTNGYPACVFQVKLDHVTGSAWSDARIYYYYARWTGTNWQKRFIAQAGRPLYNGQPDYGGGVCLDPQDPNTIYIATDATNPFDLNTITNVPLAANYQIWKGVTADGGLTFTWQSITGNSTVDNLRPYIPRRFGGEASVLWFQGTYTSYTSFAASIVGLFTTRVPAIVVTPAPKIIYVDAVSGNTALAAGGVFAPTTAASGTDDLWRSRALGNSATIFEAGGDTTTTGSAVNGDNEDVPRLETTISGLTPGAHYDLYAYFWSAGGAQDWRIHAGLTNSASDLALFSSLTAPTASAGDFSIAPLIAEADRLLHQASLGESVADGTGKITVYIDDDPVARAGIANGWNYRSWYDGIGWAQVTASYATNLSFAATANTLSISWPASHLGWILQEQTNLSTSSASWIDLPDTMTLVSTNLTIDPTIPSAFFRLRHP